MKSPLVTMTSSEVAPAEGGRGTACLPQFPLGTPCSSPSKLSGSLPSLPCRPMDQCQKNHRGCFPCQDQGCAPPLAAPPPPGVPCTAPGWTCGQMDRQDLPQCFLHPCTDAWRGREQSPLHPRSCCSQLSQAGWLGVGGSVSPNKGAILSTALCMCACMCSCAH